MRQRSITERGMTLLELMVAVAIAGLLASISIYSFSSNRQRSACHATLRQIKILLSEARQQAQSSGLPVFLRFERLSGRGTSLDGGGKLFVRWERIGCLNGQNDSWTDCPAADCLASATVCNIDDRGALLDTSQAGRACCESFGPWIEVADTFRIVNGAALLTADSGLANPLDKMCWSGTDVTLKVVSAGANKCVFDLPNPVPIQDLSFTCIDERDIHSQSSDVMFELDGILRVDSLTGLSRITNP